MSTFERPSAYDGCTVQQSFEATDRRRVIGQVCFFDRARRTVTMLLDRLNPEPGRVKSRHEEHCKKRRTSSRP